MQNTEKWLPCLMPRSQASPSLKYGYADSRRIRIWQDIEICSATSPTLPGSVLECVLNTVDVELSKPIDWSEITFNDFWRIDNLGRVVTKLYSMRDAGAKYKIMRYASKSTGKDFFSPRASGEFLNWQTTAKTCKLVQRYEFMEDASCMVSSERREKIIQRRFCNDARIWLTLHIRAFILKTVRERVPNS